MSVQMTAVPPNTPVCAIGASAGGIAALKEMFRLLPPDLGLAYVVIVHLSPEHPSTLDKILDSVTEMPVAQVTDKDRLRKDNIYLIPPDRELFINGNDVQARPFSEPRGHRAPIDSFFCSVAHGRGDGMAVILSGSGSDGSEGVRAMKGGGGVVFVQEPKTAEFGMMPRSALAAGVADFCLPIPALVDRIIEVAQSKDAVRSLPQEPAEHVLQQIVSLLKTRTGHDFSGYKRATVMRRVMRRIQVSRKRDIKEYLGYLTTHPEEAQELFNDLLISVTSFFRDPAAFDALAKEVIAPLFDEAMERDQKEIRVWVAGCATGEEAYTIGILFLEEAARRDVSLPAQIFATDLDQAALATAREGRYPDSIAAHVSDARLERFFIREGAHFIVKKELRDMVLMAEHSILKDPPFLRVDLVSCRNLLIYLDRPLQHQVASMYAYGLRPHGYLFLGSAETVDAAGDLFFPVNREVRIYRARPAVSHSLPAVTQMPPVYQATPYRTDDGTKYVENAKTLRGAHLNALEYAAPPSVLVDSNCRVLFLSDRAGRFLLPPVGPMSTDINTLVRPELRLDLRRALRRAIDSGQSTLTPPLLVSFDNTWHRVGLHVAPATTPNGGVGQVLIVFLDGGQEEPTSPPVAEQASSSEVARLREELHAIEARLSTSKSENETAIQDLRVANEELQSINEEYRSTSEELETSKEELQSMNEELQTVNAELKNKLETVGAAHSDLQNLMVATEVGSLFLDRELRIRMFTPSITQVFNVTGIDIGRPITDFTHYLQFDDLVADARRVMETLIPVEHEVEERRDGRWLLVRLRPYRTIDDRIDGVVVTCVDVTDRREAARRLQENDKRQRFLLAWSDAIRVLNDAAAIETETCQRLAEWLQVDSVYLARFDKAKGVACITHDIPFDQGGPRIGRYKTEALEWAIDILGRDECLIIADVQSSAQVPAATGQVAANLNILSCAAVPVIRDGVLVGALCVPCSEIRVWEQKETELLREVADRLWTARERACVGAALRGSEERFRALVIATSQVVYRMNPDWSAMQELDGRGFLEDTNAPDEGWADRYIPPQDQPHVWRAIRAAVAEKVPFDFEHRITREDGGTGWVHSRAAPILDEEGNIVEWFGAANDTTERREREQALRRARDELALATAAAQVGWGGWDLKSDLADWDERALKIIGLAPDDQNVSHWYDRIHVDDRQTVIAEMAAASEQARSFDLEYRVVHDDGTVRFVHGTGAFRKLVQDDEETIQGTGLVRDITELRRWEANQRMLLGELNHRVKNMLAVVNSIANQTLRNSADMETFVNSFSARIQSLSRAHSVLTQRNWEGAELRDLVQQAVSSFTAHSDSRVVIEGPPVVLNPNAALSLSLGLHELGTNATKYGAWSTPAGQIYIGWELVNGTRLKFIWRETGGPDVQPPSRKGFGTRLLTRGIGRELGGQVSVEYNERGVRCLMEFVISQESGPNETEPETADR